MAAPNPMLSPTVFDHALVNFTRNLSHKERLECSFATVSDVYREIDRLQKSQDEKRLLRGLKRAQPFVDGLLRYSSTIEQFVNVKPDVLGLLWGPLKLVLSVSSRSLECFNIILNALKRIGDVLPRFESFSLIFPKHPQIIHALVLFYEDILSFYSDVLAFFKEPGG
jgi:hypothetical protein